MIKHCLKDRVACGILLMLALMPIANLCMRPSTAADQDVWWHLQTGNWILQHHAVPSQDLFSSSMMGRPWIAYTWAFDVMIASAYHRWALQGIVGITGFLVLGSAIALFVLLRRYIPEHFAIGMVIITSLAIAPLFTPRPWLFTVLLFTIELDIILRARATGDTRRMWLLVPLFIIWANLHIQFVYGLLLLGMAAAESLVLSLLQMAREHSRICVPRICSVLLVSLLGTFVNPYGWRLYLVVKEYATQHAALKYVSEMASMEFRGLSNWLVLALVLSAIYFLGRTASRDYFLLFLEIIACYFAFRSARDAWFAVIISATIIVTHANIKNLVHRSPTYGWTIALASILAVSLVALHSRWLSRAATEESVAKTFPDKAVRYIYDHRLPGPLYNSYNWGGYLLWRLPSMPVSIDGRANLYGDSRVERSALVWAGRRDWHQDPDLLAANTVVLERDSALGRILQSDPHFKVDYEDSIAVVLEKAERAEDHRGAL